MTRAKAEKVLEGAGYEPELPGAVRYLSPADLENDGIKQLLPHIGLEARIADLEADAMAMHHTITILTAIIHAVAPARFGLAKTPEAMLKEVGGSV